MVKLLSMDTSTTSSGCAVYENGKLKGYKLITAKGKADERIKDMIVGIYDFITETKPHIVVIETPSVVRNPQTQRELCFLCGSILGKCIQDEICFYQFRPSEWRKRVKDGQEKLPRKRAELKEWAISIVNEKYGLKVRDDVAEAILIGEAYIKEFS